MSFLVNPYVLGAGRSQYFASLDGTSDYFTRGALDGASDTNTLTLSFWIIPNTLTVNRYLFDSYDEGGARISAYFNTAGKIVVAIANSSTILSHTNDTALSLGTSSHIMMSVDMSDTSKRHFYLNGVSDERFSSGTYETAAIPYSQTTASSLGSAYDGSSKADVELYDFYLTNEYLDLSDSSNRQLFYASDGSAPNLGANGSTPTGTQPLIYFNGFGNFTNRGSAGTFTINGAVTQGAEAPL